MSFKDNIDPELVKLLKQQILEELKDEDTRRREELLAERERVGKIQDEYVEKMKQSLDPWVEVMADVRDSNGLGIRLEWNDAFVAYLKENGINGTDQDQVVQKYIALLLRDAADKMEEETKGGSEYA
jgi:hypothetical protein